MIHALQKFLNLRFFHRPQALVSAWQIIWWWELRRIPFNLMVGLAGIITFLICLEMLGHLDEHFKSVLMPSGSSPISELILVFLYGIAANICYTGGWIIEILAKKLWGDRAAFFGEFSFVAGLFFSIFLTILPVFAFLFLLAATVLMHHS